VCVASSKTDLFANLIQFEHDDLIIVYKITHLFVTSAYFIHFCYRCFAENMSFRNRLPWNCVERNLSQSDEKIRLCCSFERYCFPYRGKVDVSDIFFFVHCSYMYYNSY